MKPKAILSWSSGKDSAWALHLVRQAGEYEITGLLTTLNEAADRVAMHGVRRALLEAQADAAGLSLRQVMLPWPCPNEVYEARMAEACDALKADGVTHVIFGDLFLEDIRAYRETQMAKAGLTPVFPLWELETHGLIREMLAAGVRATAVSVDPKQIDAAFAGRVIDEAFLADLPESADPCGENGEFHTVVTAGPMFSREIAVTAGETVERDGFVYADVRLA